jgi:hypothetical protein
MRLLFLLRLMAAWTVLHMPVASSQVARMVDLHELTEFGELHLNKRVTTPAAIVKVSPCAAQSNLGSTCVQISQNATQTVVIVPQRRIKNELLLGWLRDGVPVMVTGTLEMRDELSFGGSTRQAPALIVSRIDQMPASVTLHAPLRPDWEVLGVSTRDDRFYYDSREIEVANGKFSVWLLVDFDLPQPGPSGKRYRSEISRLVYDCDGTSVTTISETEFPETKGRGARIGFRVMSDKEPLDLGDRTFRSMVYNKLKGLCR